MIRLAKGLFRTTVIGTLLVGVAAGGAALFAGKARTRAVIDKVQNQVRRSIDEVIDDPTAARSQLRELEKEYPERIRQVRGDLAELQEQIRQLQRDRAVAQRVVELTDGDLAVLEPELQAAAAAQAHGEARPVVRMGEAVFSLDRASVKANQIRQTRMAYANRAADATHDLAYLEGQESRLQDLLVQLENERAQFQAQIWQLERQVDSIARNERLIDLLEKRNKTIENCSRYDVSSLDQLTSKLAEIRSRQEAELDVLANRQGQIDYEELARFQVQSGVASGAGESIEAAGQVPEGSQGVPTYGHVASR